MAVKINAFVGKFRKFFEGIQALQALDETTGQLPDFDSSGEFLPILRIILRTALLPPVALIAIALLIPVAVVAGAIVWILLARLRPLLVPAALRLRKFLIDLRGKSSARITPPAVAAVQIPPRPITIENNSRTPRTPLHSIRVGLGRKSIRNEIFPVLISPNFRLSSAIRTIATPRLRTDFRVHCVKFCIHKNVN
jgi:hypothetical protein